ncbi:15199_t:CDS:2, partial [Racocetra fulgida]
LPRPVVRKDCVIKPDGDLPTEINTGSERVRQRILDIAIRIENKIFQNSDQMINDEDYKRNCYSKLWNLKDKSNPNFVKKVASGMISPEDVANMTSE